MTDSDPGDSDPDNLIATVLDLSGAAARGLDAHGLLRRLTAYSARLHGVRASGVLLPESRAQAVRVIASNRAARCLEQIELDVGQGPCRHALRTGKPVADLPLTHPQCRARWPRFTPRALAAGITAATALPLRHRTQVLGALNLFHRHHALALSELRVGQVLANAAALGLAHHRILGDLRTRTVQLEAALTSRVVIEQAKGVLAERLHIPLDTAFELMRRHARAHHMKLPDLAGQIIDGPPEAEPFPRVRRR